MQVISLRRHFRGYHWLMRHIVPVANHPQRKLIEERVKIIKFFDQYGAPATREAFGKARSTIYLWKKRLKEAGGSLSALAPLSQAPKYPPGKRTPAQVREYIKQYRTIHPGVGKETIKPELDEYCEREGLRPISESTIGRIIKELKEKREIPDRRSKLSFYARTGKFVMSKAKPSYQKLRRGGYYPQQPGDLVQIDSIVIFLDGIKRYLLTAIDLETRFAFAHCYRRLSSKSAADFLEKLRRVTPFSLRRIQTDNGSEFGKHFRQDVQKHKITHFHNYPRHPQSNAHIERFNRTVQEQHVEWHEEELRDPKEFNRGLVEWLIWYNTKRGHKSLGYQPPLRYYLNNHAQDPAQSKMLWTRTG